MSLQVQLETASQQLALTYKQLNAIQNELLTLIEQEQQHLEKLKADDIRRVSTTMSRLPEYKAKLEEITKSMVMIDKRAAKLKRRAIYVEEQAKNGPN